MSHIRRLILPLGLTWLILLCIFTGAIVAVHLIPASAVADNTAASVTQLYEIPQPPSTPVIPDLLRHDTFTDRLILDMVRTADTGQPVRAAMLNNIPSNDLQYDDSKKVFGEGPVEDYARYWQGHQIPARIAMTFTTLRPLLIFNTVIGLILFISVIVCLWRRLPAGYPLTFAATIIISGFPLTLWSLQLTDIYFITFIAMLCVLTLPAITASARNLAVTFFTIGAVTTYFDFLTFPLFTLCFPLVAVLLMQRGADRDITLDAIISWGLGYGLLWVSKWIVGSLLTGTNLFTKAMESVGERTGALPGIPMTLIAIVAFTAMLLAAAALVGRRKHYRHNALLIVGALPVIWFLVLKNHSLLHFSFTWRTLLITFFCIITYYLVNHGGKRTNSGTHTLLQ